MIWRGDNGQGDLQVGRSLLKSKKDSFTKNLIHVVNDKLCKKSAIDDPKSEVWQEGDVIWRYDSNDVRDLSSTRYKFSKRLSAAAAEVEETGTVYYYDANQYRRELTEVMGHAFECELCSPKKETITLIRQAAAEVECSREDIEKYLHPAPPKPKSS